jgi:arylsulfatase A-like enzyme
MMLLQMCLSLILASDVGFHGAEYSTPTIDELAHSGIILDQYYVQVCACGDVDWVP